MSRRYVFAAPFAARTALALSAAGIQFVDQLDGMSRDELGDRLPDLTSAQLDGVSAVLEDCRAGAAA